MKSKQVYLTGEERLIMKTMVDMEIRSNMECKKMGIVPGFETKTLESIYWKLSGNEGGEEKWTSTKMTY